MTAVAVVTLEAGCFADIQRPAGLLSAPASAVSPLWVVTVRVTMWFDTPEAVAFYICVLVRLLTVPAFTVLIWTESSLLTQMIGHVLVRGSL